MTGRHPVATCTTGTCARLDIIIESPKESCREEGDNAAAPPDNQDDACPAREGDAEAMEDAATKGGGEQISGAEEQRAAVRGAELALVTIS